MAQGKIEILVREDGRCEVRGEFDGAWDSGSPVLTQEQVLWRMPHLLTEMRMQIELGRRLDATEGKALYERFLQSSKGSAVTL